MGISRIFVTPRENRTKYGEAGSSWSTEPGLPPNTRQHNAVRIIGIWVRIFDSPGSEHLNCSQPNYEDRTESHEQLFFACELGTADKRECGGRWNQLLCYP